MSNALHGYAKLFEKYATNNGGTGVILPGEDCLSLANEMRIDADDIDAENAKLRELLGSVFVLRHDSVYKWLDASTEEICGKSFTEQARELGFEVPE